MVLCGVIGWVTNICWNECLEWMLKNEKAELGF